MLKNITLLTILILLSSCSPYSVRKFESPSVEIPVSFNNVEKPAKFTNKDKKWWEEFDDDVLENLIDLALDKNLSLQAAWDRLKQAQEQAVITGSELYPQLSTSGSASRSRLVNPELQGALTIDTAETFYFNDFAIRNGLSFEVDIWKRVLSGKRAQEYRAEAALADAENTALLLTGTIANSWFNLNRQEKLLSLIRQQTKTSETLLELTELRFSLGKGSALDVYQQRQQLQSIKAEAPSIKAEYAATKNQLAVLLGETPSAIDELKVRGKLPKLPKFPGYISPAELMDYRPDLLATRSRLQALEYDLAKSVAERFPKLSVGLSYDFKASQIEDIFDRRQGSMFGDLIMPIIDGGRRRAVVRLTEAQVDEQVKLFDQEFLTALSDVETAIAAEKYQAELTKLLKKQLSYAQATLRESQIRYSNGLIDYLQVSLALQSLQNLERRVVSEKANLLAKRVQLHLALGGRWQHKNKDLGDEKV